MDKDREFLHAISNSLAISRGMVEIVLASLKADPNARQAEITRLEKAQKAHDKMMVLIKERALANRTAETLDEAS